MFCRHVFGNISGGFRGISRKYLNFACPRPRKISEALINLPKSLLFALYKNLNNSAALLFSRFKSEWHGNFDWLHRTTWGFLSHPKAKITEFGDQQGNKISVRTKYFFVRCTRATNVEPWAPQVECLGARRAPQNFYSGDQLWGLGTLAKMLGSPKGSLKFSLEHSLATC